LIKMSPCPTGTVVFVFCRRLYERNFNVVASSSPTTPPKTSIGRRRRPKSWNTASQNATVVLKLKLPVVEVKFVVRTARRASSSVMVLWNREQVLGGSSRIHYLTMRPTRLYSISYTPSCKTSFSRRRTGPSSGSIHGHPLVARSGSVAARKMAPATRSTGVMGMPTVRALDFQSIILVSEQTNDNYYY
jgi:hypothetical protein